MSFSKEKGDVGIFIGSFGNSLIEGNIEALKNLYTILSESNDINHAKMICVKLYEQNFNEILEIIKNETSNRNLQYYMWHFLQLMTSYSKVKTKLENDFAILPLLMKFTDTSFEDVEMKLSLNTITLNYIIYFLGGSSDKYYEHVADANVIPFIYKLLKNITISSNDVFVEPLFLCLNLLIEGSTSCKSQLYKMNFDELISDKIKRRKNAHEELLKIVNLTYQKYLLLRSEDKQFVEEFRKNFNSEAQKQVIYQPIRCSNIHCKIPEDELVKKSLKRCGRCKQASYCDKQCQTVHWKESHSKSCKILQN